MRRVSTALFMVAILLPTMVASGKPAHAFTVQDGGFADEGVLRAPPRSDRRRRIDVEERRGRGIGSAFRRAGASFGRGLLGFGSNIVRGRVVRAGKELGKGFVGTGKYTGIGVGRTGKRIGRGTKRVLRRG